MLPVEDYTPPFALLILGLVLGGLSGEESAVGVVGGGLFVWGLFWTIRIWCEHGEAIRLLGERDRVERMVRMVEELDRDRQA